MAEALIVNGDTALGLEVARKVLNKGHRCVLAGSDGATLDAHKATLTQTCVIPRAGGADIPCAVLPAWDGTATAAAALVRQASAIFGALGALFVCGRLPFDTLTALGDEVRNPGSRTVVVVGGMERSRMLEQFMNHQRTGKGRSRANAVVSPQVGEFDLGHAAATMFQLSRQDVEIDGCFVELG